MIKQLKEYSEKPRENVVTDIRYVREKMSAEHQNDIRKLAEHCEAIAQPLIKKLNLKIGS